MDPVPHWSDPALIPEAPFEPAWGIVTQAGQELLPLDRIIERTQEPPGRTLWNGLPERPDITFVTRPGSRQIVPARECPELRDAFLRRDERTLAEQRTKIAWMFFPALALTAWLATAFPSGVVLPAVITVWLGADLADAWIALGQLRRNPTGYLATQSARLRYALWLQRVGAQYRCRTCVVAITWVVIAGVQAFAPGDSVAAAGLVKASIPSEPWRLLTAPMLHGGLLHIVMNASAMLSLGALLERGVHRNLVSIVWLVGALCGSLASWAASPISSVGASGGILAVLAFLAVMAWRERGELPPGYASSMARSLVVIAVLGVLAWQSLDNAAHAGGAVAGAAIAAWLFRRPTPLPIADTPALRFAGHASDAAFLVIALFTIAKVLAFP